MKTNLAALQKINDREYSLNIAKFKEERKQVTMANKELDTLSKLVKNLEVKNPVADTMAINSAKDKTEKNTLWIKRISSDIYIDQTIKVLNNMILQKTTVKNN